MQRTEVGTLRINRAWSVPLAAVAVVAAGAVALSGYHPGTAWASAHPSLPAKTAEQLLTAAQTSDTQALSGTVTESAHWGLPSLPGAADTASLNVQGLLAGSHTVRIAIDGADRQRLAVLGSLSESDLIHNGNDLWTYTSQTNTVTHATAPARPGKQSAADTAETMTPQGAARQALAAVSPSTNVTVDSTQRVAGRSAYTLVLTPKDARSTVRKVTIALDSQHYIPLQVQIFGAGSAPAFDTHFTSISFTTPAASTFTFHAPAGSNVGQNPFGMAAMDPGNGSRTPQAAGIKTFGAGWTTVVEIPAAADDKTPDNGPALKNGGDSGTTRQHGTASIQGMLGSLTTPLGTTGDRVLRTSVLNALITSDGRIFLGAVSTDLLQSAAAGTYK